jgi:hypothetical protein
VPSTLIMEAEARCGALRQRLAAQRLDDGEIFVYGVQRHARRDGSDILTARGIESADSANVERKIVAIGERLGFPRSLISAACARLREALRGAV